MKEKLSQLTSSDNSAALPDNEWADRCAFWMNLAIGEKQRLPKRRQPDRTPLILTGHGMRLRVDRGALVVRSGLTHHPQKAAGFRFFPGTRSLPSRIVVIDGSGAITFDVLAWLAEQNIPLVQIDWRGEVITVLGGNGTCIDWNKVGSQREAQRRGDGLVIATDLIRQKVANSIETLQTVLQQSPAREAAIIKLRRDEQELEDEPPPSISALLGIEGRVAFAYFAAWRSLPLRWKGTARYPIQEDWHRIGSRQSANTGKLGKNRRASHPINAMLNYAYAVLEAQVRISIVAEGYDPAIGYLHAPAPNRPALVFDLMEPLRPIVDREILSFAQANTFHPKDFILRSDGVCRLNPEMAACAVRLVEKVIGQPPSAISSFLSTTLMHG